MPTYASAIKNLVSLAKHGAPVVLGGVLRESSYEFGGSAFAVLPLTADIIQKCITEAGCDVKSFKTHKFGEDDNPDHGIYVMDARKL